tara:strand:- start:6795 stop:7049 length:255 start_codon:yes stop_codon:yes gene_type:complete
MRKKHFSNYTDLDRIIEMAWEDRTPFDAIKSQFGINEDFLKKILKKNLSDKMYINWRRRVAGRKTKHNVTSNSTRFKSKNQKKY